jgi:transcriptional regulator with XRE-family HTH domain
VAKTKYKEGTFGAYFVNLIKEKHYTQAEFADALGVSKTYLFDVFHNRINPPTRDRQEKIIALLKLNEKEKIEFLDKAATGRGELPKDIVQFLNDNPKEILELRNKMKISGLYSSCKI